MGLMICLHGQCGCCKLACSIAKHTAWVADQLQVSAGHPPTQHANDTTRILACSRHKPSCCTMHTRACRCCLLRTPTPRGCTCARTRPQTPLLPLVALRGCCVAARLHALLKIVGVWA
jgi:hypothetical protein